VRVVGDVVYVSAYHGLMLAVVLHEAVRGWWREVREHEVGPIFP
jgi:preprotein translocase subunit Sec63